tara:strand:+ start:121 stop:906 length:786 start_codon:yes stop_codon:yes gene_type:complete
MEIDRKVAVVTGASSGIGQAVAESLGKLGLSVAVNYFKNKDGANAVAANINQYGQAAIALQADVSIDEQAQKLIINTFSEFGRIDYLVNNAGMTYFAEHGDLNAMTEDMWLDIYKVNVIGAFQVSRAASNYMRANGDGAIVNVSSIAGITGAGSSIAYAASKAALISVTKSLARSLSPEVRVNTVAPGFVDTPWWQKRPDYQNRLEAAKATTMRDYVSGPEAIADTIVPLLVHNKYVTGETIIVDGGTALNNIATRYQRHA